LILLKILWVNDDGDNNPPLLPTMSSVTGLLIEGARHVYILRYTEVASACFVAYEYLINLDYEVRFLWPRRFNFGFVLLFLCRYLQFASASVAMYTYVFTSDLRPSNCLTLMKISTGLVYCQLNISGIVLYTRAYAVWGSHRWMFWFLISAAILTIGPTVYTLVLFINYITFLPFRISNGCLYSVDDHDTNFYSMIGMVVTDSLTISLLLYKSVQHAKFMKISGGGQGASILSVIAQDGVIYFVLNITCTILNMIGVKHFPADLHGFLIGMQAHVQNVLCARLFFHLQIVNEDWKTVVTTRSSVQESKNSTPMEMKAVGRNRGRNHGRHYSDVLSDIKFEDKSILSQ